MPFVSSQQRRLFYAKQRQGEMSQATIDRWNAETKDQQASGDLPRKLPKRVKRANFDPKTLFAQAMQGALAGAIAGSRRSLDDATLQGVAQGAAIGALGGVLGGQIQGGQGQAGALIGGAGAGFVASRGPRGDSRPDLHLRIDRGTGAPIPGPQQKQASEARDQQRARAQAKGRAAGLAVRRHMEENRGFSFASGAVRNAANAVASSPDAIGAFHRALTKGASNFGHAAELAGLGILAAPTIAEMRGRHVSDKTKHRAELAGLGVLAAPSAIELGKSAVGKLKARRFMQGIKNMSKTKLLKSAAFHEALLKRAYVGPENIVGGLIGYNEGKKQKARGEKHNFGGKQLASLIIPGGVAYQIGRYVGHESKSKEKRAEDIKGDADTVDNERAALKATPLGERALADSDGKNEHPRVARAFLRRLMSRTIANPSQLK